MSRRERWENARKRALVELIEPDVRSQLAERGMTLRVSTPQFSRKKPDKTTFHWMIEAEGRRVVDFWPVSGTWMRMATGEKGRTDDPFEIVEIASSLRPVMKLFRTSFSCGECVHEGPLFVTFPSEDEKSAEALMEDPPDWLREQIETVMGRVGIDPEMMGWHNYQPTGLTLEQEQD